MTLGGTICRWRCAVVIFLDGSWGCLTEEGTTDLLAGCGCGGGGLTPLSFLLSRSPEYVVGDLFDTILAGGSFFTFWVTSPSSSIVPVPTVVVVAAE